MVGYILGNYLAEAGKITTEQLAQILENAGKVRVKLGLIAVSEGYMTTAQAEEVNRLQAVMDKRFGDIALENGYLTGQQVELLLQKQGDEYLTFLQTIVDLGIMGMADTENILSDYKKAKGLSDEESEALKHGELDRIIGMFLPQEVEAYTELIGVAVRTIIRCVDRDICLEPAFMEQSISGKDGAFQRFEAEDGSRTCTGMIEVDGGFLYTASSFAGEEFAMLDADALDSCAELLNCINGIYASSKSKEGIELELLPPEMYDEEVTLKAEGGICVLPILIKGRRFRLVVFRT